MGWFQRMKRASVRKKRRKLQSKINKYCYNPDKAAKYLRKLDALNAKYPTPESRASAAVSQQPTYNSSRVVEMRQREPDAQHSQVAKVQQAPPAAPVRPSYATTPAANKPASATAVAAAPKPSAGSQTSQRQKAGPHVPAGNYFVQHEQLVSKIARMAAQRCAKWIRSSGKDWKPINNGFSSDYSLEITVKKDGVDFNKLAYEGVNSIWFQSLGMDDLPKEKTDAFLHALKPFLDVYFPEEIEKAFADVSPLIKRSTSVTFGEHHEGWDFDGRSYSLKCIKVAMKYTFPPAPKLKSW